MTSLGCLGIRPNLLCQPHVMELDSRADTGVMQDLIWVLLLFLHIDITIEPLIAHKSIFIAVLGSHPFYPSQYSWPRLRMLTNAVIAHGCPGLLNDISTATIAATCRVSLLSLVLFGKTQVGTWRHGRRVVTRGRRGLHARRFGVVRLTHGFERCWVGLVWLSVSFDGFGL